MADILLLNGPNLNLLGRREPKYYGQQTLATVVGNLIVLANKSGISLLHKQSNAETDLIQYIHNACDEGTKYIIINPAAFTHSSIALRDALLAVDIAFIEIHISNLYKRENFRAKSYFSDIASGVILGFGVYGYEMAVVAAVKYIQQLEDK